ncbi:hypothetical protein A5695_02490 [Mycobacterium sp. E1747]|nr:hypothetical protein A5695_02490 [Mycobacterium sp. E1747]
MDVLSTVSTRRTPQSEQSDPRQKRNAAGGYTFLADVETRLHRFLTLGTEGGTYYTSAKDLTADNAQVVRYFVENRPNYLVATIVGEGCAHCQGEDRRVLLRRPTAFGDVDDGGH